MVLSLLLLLGLGVNRAGASLAMPANWSGEWSTIGRTKTQTTPDSFVIEGGFAVDDRVFGDAEITFRARAPRGTEQVQIWGGFRCRDRNSRYVFALRGGNDNDLYIARYAPDGNAKFLGFAPLDFKPVPGIWYRLRAVMLGSQIHIYLNDETIPRLNVTDQDALWGKGTAFVGGGWLPAEFADFNVRQLNGEDRRSFHTIGNQQWMAPAVDKETLRKSQRAGYVPEKVTDFKPLRTEISLDGNWLFLPDYQLPTGPMPIQLNYDDQNWHIMTVPSFWKPGLSWLHGETSFTNYLDGFSTTKGVADSLYVQEVMRCNAYTFDWRKTSSAWYRHYIDLPPNLNGRHFVLTFDAIAKISEVWVNGNEVGAHTGMFGKIKCDVTKAIKPGQNIIAVHVTSQARLSGYLSNKVEGVAVTVEVTSAMLHSLPHGMFQDDVAGIWQPVKLTVTAPVLIDDCFIEPGLHGADINLDILNTRQQKANVSVDYTITSAQDGSLFCSNLDSASILVMAGETGHLNLATPHLTPKLWSPQDPNLYDLEVRLKEQDQIIDRYKVRFGFRTFAVEDDKLLLNGQPFWLRGANPFPNTLRPNDETLARRFMEMARDGNIRVTRSHIVPFTSTWLDAADEIGMAVSFEGTWPWLMLSGEPPDERLLQDWKEEYVSLIREYRNHPSIILWTVNNEMKFEQFDQPNPELLKKKWLVLDDMIKAIRQTDPTRPVVADSSYVRKETQQGYATLVEPAGLDDGDSDDVHRYYGWYNESFFHLYDGKFNGLSTSNRPLISQEMSTGYPNNDDGHPVRFYLFKHYTPQALVGDDAYENADPAIFLKRQAFMTKELAETLRRTSHGASAGMLFFSYFTWFQTPWSVDRIRPWSTYYALKTALQPVLVSAELYGRHFYAGSTIRRRVCVINDSESNKAISNSRLIWEFQYDGNILAQGQIEAPSVDYYENRWMDVDFTMPPNLPAPRIDGQLVLKLEADGKTVSENNYDITVATDRWADGDFNPKSKIAFWNPGKHSTEAIFGLPVLVVNSIDSATSATNLLVIGGLDNNTLTPSQIAHLRSFVYKGGQVLMLHPGISLKKLFPSQVKSFTPKEGEITSMQVPESPAFSGIDPLDLAWFERGDRKLPLACTGTYEVATPGNDVTALIFQCDIHGYLEQTFDVTKISGTPLLEFKLGRGRLLASEMCLESGKSEPIARRLLMNCIHFLQH